MKIAKNINRGKRHYEPFLFLMFITIIIITGFQAYWLKNTYDREERSMQIKANAAFQETVRHLQTTKLKLRDPSFPDSLHKATVRLIVNSDFQENTEGGRELPKKEIITMVNAMRDKIADSLNMGTVNSAVIISMDKKGARYDRDSLHGTLENRRGGDNKFFKFLYGVDSLQDSLKLPEITAAYQAKMKEEEMPVPFKVIRLDSTMGNDGDDVPNVTVGFAHPITYHLELENSFPYLLKRILLPVLFSIFLIAVTILSFVVLYRSILKQQRLADLKNEFIGNITHELKTPIATVGVAIEALRNFNAIQDPQRTKEYLDISANELQRLSLLVDKVLKLSMFEKKEVDLKYEVFDVKEVVDEVVASMRLQIEKYGANVSVSREGNTNLSADRLHLLSVVFNLLDNALKYGKGETKIQIGMKGDEKKVELSFTDNGMGIPPEYKNKIFEKFFRVPSGNTHNAKGYGLGLSYVAHVVEKHHGEITVNSELDKWTTIIITLPKNQA